MDKKWVFSRPMGETGDARKSQAIHPLWEGNFQHYSSNSKPCDVGPLFSGISVKWACVAFWGPSSFLTFCADLLPWKPGESADRRAFCYISNWPGSQNNVRRKFAEPCLASAWWNVSNDCIAGNRAWKSCCQPMELQCTGWIRQEEKSDQTSSPQAQLFAPRGQKMQNGASLLENHKLPFCFGPSPNPPSSPCLMMRNIHRPPLPSLWS